MTESAGDYSYDLAHEEIAEQQRAAPAAEPDTSQAAVATGSGDDQGGDYSYDLAHEVPPAGRR